MPIAVIYIAAGLLFLGAPQLHLPYGYYTVLRIVATGVFLWAAFLAFNRERPMLPWVYALFTIIFNPVIKIYLPKELWMVIDIAAGAMLLLTQNIIKQQSPTKIV